MESKLTERQKKFCERYAANGGNATEAATFAGYAHPQSQGERMLKNVDVSDYIKTLTQPEQNKRIATAIDRQEFWTSLMYDTEIEAKDRIKASELLAKSQGDFIKRVELSGAVKHEPKTLADFYNESAETKSSS
jgi:phage terminase small subunit